ncbi:MAG: hypothetical protein HOY78_38160 [Saccharothrix sp.]|nr:hypothetical protein [Saccharothrix sp.]
MDARKDGELAAPPAAGRGASDAGDRALAGEGAAGAGDAWGRAVAGPGTGDVRGAVRAGVRRWALVAGLAGLAAGVLLVLFFVVDQPWVPGPHGSGWLGPANDVLVAVQFSALIPVALGLRRGVLLGVPAMAAVVVLQVLLVADVLPFEVQVVPVTAGIALAVGWVLVVSRRARLPRRAARVGTVVALAYFAGLAVVLAALLLPWGSTAQWVGFGVGGLVGVVGFLGFGVWPLWLARAGR